MPLGRVYVPPPRSIQTTTTTMSNGDHQIGYDEDWDCLQSNQMPVTNGYPQNEGYFVQE